MKMRPMKIQRPEPATVDPRRRLRPRPYPREIMVMDDQPPLAQICIYESCVVLTRREANGAWRSYPINPDALAQALGKLPASTGLLPGGTIGTGIRDGSPFYIQYIRPRRIALPAEQAGVETVYHFTTPPLIWAGWRQDYRLFALKEAERIAPTTELYYAPFPNAYPNGGICWGNVKRLAANPSSMGTMLTVFLEQSRFNGHLANGKSKAQSANVLLHYAALRPDEPYPLDDLVASSRTVRELLDGFMWGGAG